MLLFNPLDPGCHLVDGIQNAKEIFCVLSFKFNMFITRDSLHYSRFLSFFMYSDNEAKFQTQLTLKAERNRERLAIFSSCHAERKKLSGLKGLTNFKYSQSVFHYTDAFQKFESIYFYLHFQNRIS
jgi:hypothetical protein